MYSSNNHSSAMDDRERNRDKPPYSRVFVVCSKQTREEDLRTPFEQYGNIEDLYMPRDRNSGESKGVAYIKFEKTSSAAAAIQALHEKPLKINNKPIKVMVASSKNDSNSTNEEKFKRLFIKVHKEITEKEIYDHFSTFGEVNSVYLQKDKATDKCKGFAYVHFNNFLNAAKAFEECDKIYKPVFATPKDELKRSRNSLEGPTLLQGDNSRYGSPHCMKDNYYNDHCNLFKDNNQRSLLPNTMGQNYNTVVVTCSPQVPQKYIENLLNIVPGMEDCQYTVDAYNGFCKAIVTYKSESAAAHAVERVNNFQFPSGEIVSVKPDDNALNKVANNLTNMVNSFKNSVDAGNPDLHQLAEAIAQASSLIKAATTGKMETKKDHMHREPEDNNCNVALPPPQPMANCNSRVAQRCFIVCKPYPPPITVLRDAFSRFGDLIDVSTIPNKTFGFVKYASVRAAQEAIKSLNGAVLCGIQLKVLEADEKPSKDDDVKMTDLTDNSFEQNSTKRIKLHDRNSDN